MENLTLEQVVLFKTLAKIAIGEEQPLNAAEKRHYIHGMDLINQLESVTPGFDLDDLVKLKQSTLDEVVFKKA